MEPKEQPERHARVGTPYPPPPASPTRWTTRLNRAAGCLALTAYLLFSLLVTANFPIVGALMLLVGAVFYCTSGWSRHAERRKRRTLAGIRWGSVAVALGVIFGYRMYADHVERLVVPTTEYYETSDFGPYLVSGLGSPIVPDKSAGLTLSVDSALRIDSATSLSPLGHFLVDSVFAGGGVSLDQSTTPAAYDRLLAGSADLIFAFPPSEEQRRRAAESGKTLRVTPIGLDAFVFFVNRDNPVDTLTVGQLRDIYAGRVKRWSEVGGPDESLVAFQRPAGSGSQSRMERFMAGDVLAPARREWYIASMGGIVERVARYRNYRYALGYSFLYYVANMVDANGLKLLRVDGVAPSTETIRDGRYPLTDPICVVTAGTVHPAVEPFVRWMGSEEGRRLVEKAGYVPAAAGAAGGGDG